MSCQEEEKKMLHLILFQFQESQQSSDVANKPKSFFSFSHTSFFKLDLRRKNKKRKKVEPVIRGGEKGYLGSSGLPPETQV